MCLWLGTQYSTKHSVNVSLSSRQSSQIHSSSYLLERRKYINESTIFHYRNKQTSLNPTSSKCKPPPIHYSIDTFVQMTVCQPLWLLPDCFHDNDEIGIRSNSNRTLARSPSLTDELLVTVTRITILKWSLTINNRMWLRYNWNFDISVFEITEVNCYT